MLRDEQRAESAKLKNAPFKEKINYFWSYYKVHTIVTVLAIPFILWVILTILHSDTDYLQIVITDQMGDTLSTEYIENIYNTNIENPVSINFETSMELANRQITETNMLNHEKLLALYQSKTLDVFISPESVFQNYGPEGMFSSLDTLLPEEIFQELDAQGRILYVTLTDYSEEDSEAASEKEPVVVAAGLYINDTKLTADSGMNITDACIGIAYNTKRPQDALKFLELYL